jgi:hypothetical protein
MNEYDSPVIALDYSGNNLVFVCPCGSETLLPMPPSGSVLCSVCEVYGFDFDLLQRGPDKVEPIDDFVVENTEEEAEEPSDDPSYWNHIYDIANDLDRGETFRFERLKSSNKTGEEER